MNPPQKQHGLVIVIFSYAYECDAKFLRHGHISLEVRLSPHWCYPKTLCLALL